MEFNFIDPGHITTKFDAAVIMWEEFEINMFGEVSYLTLGRSQATSPISRRSVRHTKIAVTKRLCDKTTGYLLLQPLPGMSAVNGHCDCQHRHNTHWHLTCQAETVVIRSPPPSHERPFICLWPIVQPTHPPTSLRSKPQPVGYIL